MDIPARGAVDRADPIWCPRPRPDARVKLLCFAHAGGGANVFRGWDDSLGEDVELAAVQLPGREWRRGEPALRRIDSIGDHLLPAVQAWLDDARPGVFFGYSMGAAVAYTLAVRLRDAGAELPRQIVVAACRAPQLLGRTTSIHALPDAEFEAAVRRFGGMPDAVLAEPALLQLALPVLRADFEALGTYRWQPQAPLPIPLTVYGGSNDPHATRAELAQWRVHTNAAFQLRLFGGGHFFINESGAQLRRTLAADLAQVRGAVHMNVDWAA